ncbi:MAG: HDOD domain-containing protein, partial [Candidatus Latescibacterota bacterium]
EQKKEFNQLYLSDRSVEYLKALRLYSTFELGEDEDPFVSGMMHDIGKVALVHCYPGLYNTFVRTLEQSNWTLTMKDSEEQTSGVDHVQVGGILARNWQLAQYLQNVIHKHHTPDKGDSLARLICLSSFMASAFYSYPAKAKTPLKQAVEPMVDNLDDRQIGFDPNDLDATEHIEAMLPKGFLRSIGVSLYQVLQLSSVLGADVRKQLEGIRGSMKD